MTSQVFIQTKVCSKCKQTKSISEFSKNKTRKDGLHSCCKECGKVYNSNKSHRAVVSRVWYIANKEEKIKVVKERQKLCPELVNANNAKRRASRIQATPKWCETKEIKTLFEHSKMLTETTGIEHHVDHIVPLVSEFVCGLHCLANLRVIPASENLSKSNLYWPDMP